MLAVVVLKELLASLQILCSFGVDTLEALASTCTLYAVGDRQRWAA
jgi:hypothetical protein